MKVTTYFAVSVFILFTAFSASPQETSAPNISGTSIQGSEVDLNEFNGEKNVLVVFYRMHTWPYCQQQLGELQANYEEIQAMGAEIVALSADTPEQARVTVSELGITYPILSDSSRTYIRAYDVLHPQEGIARPSVFVLDRDGVVRWQHVGMNAADRPAIGDVLEQLRALQ